MTKSNAVQAQEFLNENAASIGKAIALFQESAALFSSRTPRMIDEYENKWVAAHDGEIVAVAESMDTLLAIMSERGIPANESMVRHIDRELKTLIL